MLTTTNSKVTWAIVIMFVVGGLNAITGVLSPTWATIVSGVIGILGIFTHNAQITAGRVK